MTPLTSFVQLNKADDLELHIDDLTREINLIESIERFRDCMGFRLDHSDLKSSHILLAEERERCQEQLRNLRGQSLLLVVSEEGGFEEEEEEASPSHNYSIEHVVRDEKGRLKPLEPHDLDMGRNEGVKDAFKVIYEMQRDYEMRKEHDDAFEEDEEEAVSRFGIEDQEWFVEMVEGLGGDKKG